MSKCCLSFSIALSDGVRSPSLSIAQFARPLLPTFVCSYRCPRNRTVPPWWALHFSFVCWFCHLATQSFFFHLCFICAQLLGLCGCPREGWPDGRSGLLMSIEYRSSRHILSPATPRRSSLFSACGWFRLPRRAELLHVSISVRLCLRIHFTASTAFYHQYLFRSFRVYRSLRSQARHPSVSLSVPHVSHVFPPSLPLRHRRRASGALCRHRLCCLSAHFSACLLLFRPR